MPQLPPASGSSDPDSSGTVTYSVQWYEEGWKQIEGEYVDGKRFGKWIFYNEDRSIDVEKLFGEEI